MERALWKRRTNQKKSDSGNEQQGSVASNGTGQPYENTANAEYLFDEIVATLFFNNNQKE
jgi:hypothetical protein